MPKDSVRTRVVLLAAGQGKRMKSQRPKVLHEVLGLPILGRILRAVDRLMVEHVHLIVGHAAEQVMEYLAEHPPQTPHSVHLQEPQLGTGHALMQAAPELESFEGTLLVSVADTPLLTSETLAALVATHKKDNAIVSLLTTRVKDPKNYGRILRDKSGSVTAIIEDKDASDEQKKITEINPAIYCFAWPEVKDALFALKNDNRQKEYYLTDLIGWAAQDKRKVASSEAPDWREVAGINSRLELAEAARHLRDITVNKLALESGVTIVDSESTWIGPEVSIGQDSVVQPNCSLYGDILIGNDCVIGPNTVISGLVRVGNGTTITQSLVTNCEIGDNCRIGPYSHLREHTVLSNGVRVGNFVEIKKSQIGERTNASHLSYVGDTTIGSRANVGAGTITANYDHITKKKQRTIIGDGASTGSNSVLVAPVTLGKEAVVAAGSVVTKDVPDGALAITRPKQENKEGWADRRRGQSQSPPNHPHKS